MRSTSGQPKAANPLHNVPAGRLGDQHIHELVDRLRLQLISVLTQFQDTFSSPRRKTGEQVPAELAFQNRDALPPAATVADGILYGHLVRVSAILEKHLDGIGDGAFRRVVVVR